jgi:farnesyl-diphosphate farnesyltransferase
LASVSRSFYLSIRILPSGVRQPIGCAYLLARASDTIADIAQIPASERRRHLAAFAHAVQTDSAEGLQEIKAAIRSPHPGEAELIRRLDECIELLATADKVDRTLIHAVLSRIIHGQDLDLVRFGDATKVVALQSAADLEEYTYLVAGCVGEFWTDVCLHHCARFSTLDPEPLRKLAVDFGKALQLVNILRDLPADLRQNRCYLPADEIDPAVVVTDPISARECFARWRQRAEDLLDAGRRYTASLRPARLRAACFLPWSIGNQTLRMLAAQSPLESKDRIKIPRSAVRATMVRAIVAAFSNRPLAA